MVSSKIHIISLITLLLFYISVIVVVNISLVRMAILPIFVINKIVIAESII